MTNKKSAETYTQCHLEKAVLGGKRLLETAFIPTRYAKLGKFLKLKQEDGIWNNGWKVTFVGQTLSADIVESNERDYLRTREASDI